MAHRLEFYLRTFVEETNLVDETPWKILFLNTDEFDSYLEDMNEYEICFVFVNGEIVKAETAFEVFGKNEAIAYYFGNDGINCPDHQKNVVWDKIIT